MCQVPRAESTVSLYIDAVWFGKGALFSLVLHDVGPRCRHGVYKGEPPMVKIFLNRSEGNQVVFVHFGGVK